MKKEFGFFAVAVLTICLVYFAFLRSGSNSPAEACRNCAAAADPSVADQSGLFIPAGVVYLVFGALAVSPILAEERLRRAKGMHRACEDRSPHLKMVQRR